MHNPGRSPVLSNAQIRIARAVAEFEQEERPAFVPDVVKRLGLAGESSITPTLRKMHRAGFIEIFGGGKQRAYRLLKLTPKGRYAIRLSGVLPVLGLIPAGPLQEALEQPEELIDASKLLSYQQGDFLLRVRGDSMMGDGILDGDKVLLRPDVEVPQGGIAAALVGDDHEATLKRVYKEKDKIRLKASNPKYHDIIVPASSVKIAGVFRGLIRDAERSH